MSFDRQISEFILEHFHGSDVVNHIMKFFSMISELAMVWIIIFLIYIAYIGIKRKKVSVALVLGLVTLLLGYICNDLILKPLFDRSRPYQIIEAFKLFMDSINYSYPTGHSFPSGHSFFSFELALILTLYNKKLGFVVYPLAIVIAFSRIFLGAHYFSDVLMGITLGSLFGLIHYVITNMIMNTKKIKELTYAIR